MLGMACRHVEKFVKYKIIYDIYAATSLSLR